jgi:hypothetical protein
MRIAAGIILIILGVVRVANVIISMGVLPGSFVDSHSLFEGLWMFGYWPVVYGALFVTGGILCIGKRYWGLCLISALLALVGGIYTVVQALWLGYSLITWEAWILVVGALISTIFVSLTKYEWEEISD